jgi:hypothetical protein
LKVHLVTVWGESECCAGRLYTTTEDSAATKRMRKPKVGVIPLPDVLSYLAHSDMLCTSFHFTARGDSEDYPLSYSNCPYAT